MTFENDYTNESFEAGIRQVISRYFIREDYCPTCRGEANFVKMVDCMDYWRCMGCQTVLHRTFAKLEATNLKDARKETNKQYSFVEDDDDVEIGDEKPSAFSIAMAKRRIITEEIAQEELAKTKQNSQEV